MKVYKVNKFETSSKVSQKIVFENCHLFFDDEGDHNLIEGGHIEGMMFSIENDLTLITNPDVPIYFKQASLLSIKKVIKELKSINKGSDNSDYQEYIDEIESIVSSAQGIM